MSPYPNRHELLTRRPRHFVTKSARSERAQRPDWAQRKVAGRSNVQPFQLAANLYCNDFHSRLRSPYTHESDTSLSTMQSSRSVPSRINPSFSSTRPDAVLRVSASD